ncbi:MAG: hypothetical protein ACR2KM_08760 [Gemmatimonadaceae bacterium]
MIRTLLAVIGAAVLSYATGCALARLARWFDTCYPIAAAPSPAPLVPLTYWAGPKDGETVTATAIEGVALYGEFYPTGVYRFDATWSVYRWREWPSSTVDWPDLERPDL